MRKKHLSKCKMISVEARTLRIHPRAQRDLVPTKLKKITADMDLDAIGVLHAVEYEIKGIRALWIIDGQHRWRALMDLGFGEWIVEVKVHLDVLDDARACALFLKLNDRTLVKQYDKFLNELAAGLPAAVGVDRITREHGLRPASHAGDGCVAGVSTLKKLHEIDGGATLSSVLGTAVSAWGRTAGAMESRVLEGLGKVFSKYNGVVDQTALVRKLAKYPAGARRLLGDARGMQAFEKCPVSSCVAALVIRTYNTSRRSGKLDPL